MTPVPTLERLQSLLEHLWQQASSAGAAYVDVNAGELHRDAGGYPGSNHRMPMCCSIMRRNMREGDAVLSEPPSGQGASLTIRYKLPR